MRLGAYGVTELTTRELELILRAVHHGELVCPFDRQRLAEGGFIHLGDKIDFLSGKSEETVKAVVIAALAERRR